MSLLNTLRRLYRIHVAEQGALRQEQKRSSICHVSKPPETISRVSTPYDRDPNTSSSRLLAPAWQVCSQGTYVCASSSCQLQLSRNSSSASLRPERFSACALLLPSLSFRKVQSWFYACDLGSVAHLSSLRRAQRHCAGSCSPGLVCFPRKPVLLEARFAGQVESCLGRWSPWAIRPQHCTQGASKLVLVPGSHQHQGSCGGRRGIAEGMAGQCTHGGLRVPRLVSWRPLSVCNKRCRRGSPSGWTLCLRNGPEFLAAPLPKLRANASGM